MRGMRLIMMAAAVCALGLLSTALPSRAQTTELVPWNATWKYQSNGVSLDGTGWQTTGYSDTSWPVGQSVLAWPANEAMPAGAPLTIRTTLGPFPTPQPVTYYFRTTFNWSGPLSGIVLTASNVVDDGCVVYINGTEIGRVAMPSGAITSTSIATRQSEVATTRFDVFSVSGDGIVQSGVNTVAVEAHQGAATGSSDIVYALNLRASIASPPHIDDPQQPRDTNVVQCQNATLSVVASGAPAPNYQWYKDFGQIPNATNASYTITNMTAADAGDYYVNVNNVNGSVDSRVAHVSYSPDTVRSRIVKVQGDPVNLSQVVVTFSEAVDNAQDGFNWIFDCKDPGTCPATYTVLGGAYNAAGDQVTLTIDPPRDPSIKYTLTPVPSSMTDHCNPANTLTDGTYDVVVPAVFRQGTAGYTGTQDTELRSDTPDAVQGARADFINIDQSDGTPAGPTHGLLRFDNIVGGGPGQIPAGATINSIQLVLPSSGANAFTVNEVHFHRMLVDWSQATATWNSMNSGLSADDVEASSVIDAAYTPNFASVPFTVTRTDDGLKATVQAWVNGAPNYGWAILPTGTDGYRIDTSENPSENQRPMLIVDFSVSVAPCHITQDPASTTVAEGNTFTLSVISTGSDLTYQWYKNNVAISGATSSSYSKRAVPGDAGTYKVVVHNSVGADCTSANATVTVNADTTRDNVVSAVGNPDGTITVTFDDDMLVSSAQNTANYVLSPSAAISSAVYNAASRSVTLTAALAPGTAYSLTVQNVKDDSVAGNVIFTKTFNPLEYRVRLLAFDATWKYNNSGCDLSTAGWAAPSYNDSAWPSAGALLGLETTAGTLTSLQSQGLNTNNLRLLSRTNANGCGIVGGTGATNMADYFRTTLNIPFNPAGALIVIRHVIDDGAVFYFNGVEAGRFNMTNGPVNNLTPAPGTMAEGVIRGQVLNGSALHSGANTLAVEVHQDAPGSSDVVLGVEVNAYFGAARPKLNIVPDGPGNVVISWTPKTGILQTNGTLNGFWNDAGQANPQTNSATASRFYSIRP